jgi:hypothetical protein
LEQKCAELQTLLEDSSQTRTVWELEQAHQHVLAKIESLQSDLLMSQLYVTCQGDGVSKILLGYSKQNKSISG